MKLLHIDASILGDNSASKQIAATLVARFQKAHPGLEVLHRDLGAAPLPHLSLGSLPSDHPIAATLGALAEQPEVKKNMGESQAALDEFLAADIVVVGSPLYNFGISSQLKAWIDRIVVPGKTFQYGSNGAEGLAGAKRVVLAVARGGVYQPGTAGAAIEHGETYLRGVFAFMGVTNLQVIVAEGLSLGAEARAKAMDAALSTAAMI
jgi:FMN-dependent NADH-azoreductase